MRIKLFLTNIFCLFFILSIISCDGFNLESDNADDQLVGFFDLRDRDTFIQLTNTGSSSLSIHIQIFDVENNCNENDFFDEYTGNDTHVYNLRNIESNDGKPSGVVLPQNAYGFVVMTVSPSVDDDSVFIGNFRVIDNNGYEYRTNLLGSLFFPVPFVNFDPAFTFNYNVQGEVSLSDIVGIVYRDPFFETDFAVEAANLTESWALLDIDILDLNENVFSCRNVIFACTDQDNPLLESLLEFVPNNSINGDSANVASFEYGINNAIPHSKGSELLCPGNNIEEGFVKINLLGSRGTGGMFVGLNNGNGRGSMDSFWIFNASCFSPDAMCGEM